MLRETVLRPLVFLNGNNILRKWIHLGTFLGFVLSSSYTSLCIHGAEIHQIGKTGSKLTYQGAETYVRTPWQDTR